jgi:hypothetical protein
MACACSNMFVAVLGDLSAWLAQSAALRDFVRECNRGTQIWLVASREDLGRRLDPA